MGQDGDVIIHCGNSSVTVIFRHRKWTWAGITRLWPQRWRFKIVTDFVNQWRFSLNRHGGQFMMLNPWRSPKPSQMMHNDDYLVIRDGNFSSWISRILVVPAFACTPTRGRPQRATGQEVPATNRRGPAIVEVLATTETTFSTSSDEDDDSWAGADFSITSSLDIHGPSPLCRGVVPPA
jgi:hypothetical protein